MGRLFLWLFLAALIGAGVWVYFFLVDAGVFLNIEPKTVGACRQVTSGNIAGVEDIARPRLPISLAMTGAG
jgi:hypothetical protein